MLRISLPYIPPYLKIKSSFLMHDISFLDMIITKGIINIKYFLTGGLTIAACEVTRR